MRLALAVLGLCVVIGCAWGLLPGTKAPESASPPSKGAPRQEAFIHLAPDDDWRSPLGVFPPSEVIDPKDLRTLGVKNIDLARLGDALPIETRRTPDGSYVTQIGEALFLTQRPRASAPSEWTLRVPPGVRGTLRVVAVSIGGDVGLGVERSGDFARLAWSDEHFSYVFFDIGNAWGIERLVHLAESLG